MNGLAIIARLSSNVLTAATAALERRPNDPERIREVIEIINGVAEDLRQASEKEDKT